MTGGLDARIYGGGSDGVLSLTANATLGQSDDVKQYERVELNGFTLTVHHTTTLFVRDTLDFGSGGSIVVDHNDRPGGSGGLGGGGGGLGGNGGGAGGLLRVFARRIVGTGSVIADGEHGDNGQDGQHLTEAGNGSDGTHGEGARAYREEVGPTRSVRGEGGAQSDDRAEGGVATTKNRSSASTYKDHVALVTFSPQWTMTDTNGVHAGADGAGGGGGACDTATSVTCGGGGGEGGGIWTKWGGRGGDSGWGQGSLSIPGTATGGGGGGGGAGGVIVVWTEHVDDTVTFRARGGNGGDGGRPFNSNGGMGGPGGGGSGGFIMLVAPTGSAPTFDVTAGTAGARVGSGNLTGVEEATDGESGVTFSVLNGSDSG